ncbi:hypothetical protein FB45DRAFT_1131085 [Roridomyces roridus]|uniref:Uncharacterized protein n=1 Tax=Roridomyces roridus TaxID=1738132 RepID=A0AAD7B1Q8_9AGAR|nr:hypothetical protein FB45DRAFT_1131085 [Roridomyces roridus]
MSLEKITFFFLGSYPLSPPPPPNCLKRKTPPTVEPSPPAAHAVLADDDDEQEDRKPLVLSPGTPLPPGGVSEYASGRVICESCGTAVSFRDEDPSAPNGGFTTRHWDAHRMACAHHHPHLHHHHHQNIYPPPPPFPLSQHNSYPPPAKRRRAKRTEEGRIAYLRSDPHVAQFEAYRVLCASCDKWIRLRPNSTYCSIPWDAHRKSCLARKGNARALYGSSSSNPSHPGPNTAHANAIFERTAIERSMNVAATAVFAKDPSVRKFDAERLLCGLCDKWIALPADDVEGSKSIGVWQHHRETCMNAVSALKNLGGSTNPSTANGVTTGSNMEQDAEDECKPIISSPPRPSSTSVASAPPPPPPPQTLAYPPRLTQGDPPFAQPPLPTHLPLPTAPHLVLDLSPTNYAAPHESRRRNAEQRAATLRADVLIREVEPNRVFCTLCTKWVQLRQDSSYCAYPWLQHRGKCLARYQRRAQKAQEISTIKAKRPANGSQHHSTSGLSPESEDSTTPGAARSGVVGATSVIQHPPRAHAAVLPLAAWPPHPAQHHHRRQKPATPHDVDADADGEADVDAEGEVDADGDSCMEEQGTGSGGGNNAAVILRRAVPATFADLDSEAGRRIFIHSSIAYLFRTTYEPAHDRLSISALLAYLNTAMPTDKHEDFDTGEVVRAAAALAQAVSASTRVDARRDGRMRFALEGDMLRVV